MIEKKEGERVVYVFAPVNTPIMKTMKYCRVFDLYFDIDNRYVSRYDLFHVTPEGGRAMLRRMKGERNILDAEIEKIRRRVGE